MNPTTLGDWRTVRVVTLAVIAAATGVAINIGSSGPTTISITVQGPSGPTALTTTAAAIEQLKSSQAGNHRGARDETPRGVTAKQLVAGSDQLKRLAASDDFPSLAPDAAPQTAGCRSRFVRNFSSRNGVKPRLIVLHLTASPNNGWTGVNAITGYFNEPATQVSSHYVVSGNGLCNYVVRETDKAWTQAAFNSLSISFEVTATQSQGYYVDDLGRARLAQIIAGISARWGIPLRRGAVHGCTVTRSGIVDHSQLGACGGGHNDINPYRDEILRITHSAQMLALSESVKVRNCNELAMLRRKIHLHRSTSAERNRARRLIVKLRSSAFTCP